MTTTRDSLYIDGSWVTPAGTGTIEVLNSTTEEVVGTVPEGNADDADRAVKAARAAFDSWAFETPAEERVKYLQRLMEGLSARQEEIATLISQEVGMVLSLSRIIQAGLPIAEMGASIAALD